jgi:tape measure domain-containing protein
MAARTFSFRLSAEGGQDVINTLKGLAANSNEAERALRTLTQASPQLASVQDGVQAKVRATAAAMKEATAETSRFQQVMAGLSSATGSNLGSAFAQGGAFALGMEAARMAAAKLKEALEAIPKAGDEARQALGRLSATLGDTGQAGAIFERLQAISRGTGVPIADTAAQFQRFAIAAKDVGATADQVVRLVEGIQKFGIVSGSSTQETAAATQQLGQALASGKFQGDELRSVLENMPMFAQALARELGTSIGALRQMGADGKLTSDVVFPAMLRAVEGIDATFAKMPNTMARAQQQFTSASDAFLVSLDKSLGLSDRLIASLERAARVVDSIRRGLGGTTQGERLGEITGRVSEIDRQLGEINRLQPNDPASALALQGNEGVRSRLTAERSALIGEQQDIMRQAREMERADAEAARMARREADRTRAATEIGDLREKLDAKFKAEKEYQDRTKQLNDGLNKGVITEAEYAKLSALALEDRNKALEKGAKATKENNDETDKFLKLLRDQQKEAKAVEEQLDPTTAAWNRYNEAIGKIREGVQAGVYGQGRGTQLEGLAWERLNSTLNGTVEKVDQADQSFAQFFSNATSGFEDAITKGGKFSDVLKGIESDLVRMITRLAITGPLFDALKSSGIGSTLVNGAKDIFSGLFGPGGRIGAIQAEPTITPIGVQPYADGGIMTSRGPLPLKRYAAGGIANTPQFSMFGEGSMPEAYVPLPDGRSIPVNMRGGGGMSVVQNVNVNVGGSNASPAMITAAARLGANQAKAELVAEMNRGGDLAKTFGRRR